MNPLLLAALAFGVGYFLLRKPARFIGDKAQAGDEVFVNVAQLGGPVPGLPANVGQVVVKVTATSAETVTGPVTGFALTGAANFVPTPTPIGPIPVSRAAIGAVTRNGKTVSL